jgi:hypothetical protein
LKFCESTKQIFCSATERILKHQNVSENKPKRKRSFIGGTVAGRVKAQRFLLILIGPHQNIKRQSVERQFIEWDNSSNGTIS